MPFDGKTIRALTFDCYGTLVDWDAGIREALEEIEGLEGCDVERLLADRENAERELIAGPYRIYSGILGDSLKAAAAAQGRALPYSAILGFINSMNRWPPFRDSGGTLRRLAFHYVLALLSNAETKVLQASVKRIGAPFVALITAEDLHSYKPAPKHWEATLKRLHHPSGSILHIAGSLYHDIRPARALGFQVAWINRRKEPVPEDVDPATVYPDLTSLAEALLVTKTAG